jgi:Protein of unknown function (DUF2911)
MRIVLCGLLPFAFCLNAMAQYPGLTLPPSGNNQKAMVTQFIGPVQVSIEYSSPAVHGPDGKDRRGQIWGKLVPYGVADLGFGNGKPSPWRAGANENTVFTVSNDVTIEGKPLPAGKYGLFMIPGPDEWTLVFSKNSSSWGSFFYEDGQDALRVTVKPAKHEYREWLTYEFPERKPAQATAQLEWEELSVPWTIKAEVNPIYISRLRQELTSVPGFTADGFAQAATFCVQENVDLDEGLKWADAALTAPFIGQVNFDTLTTKAQVLDKMGRDAEAKTEYRQAMRHASASAMQIYALGLELLKDKENDFAMEVFEYDAERYKDTWPVHMGLARGYAAKGDNEKALEHANKALAQAPSDPAKARVKAFIEELPHNQAGKG